MGSQRMGGDPRPNPDPNTNLILSLPRTLTIFLFNFNAIQVQPSSWLGPHPLGGGGQASTFSSSQHVLLAAFQGTEQEIPDGLFGGH